MRVLGQSDGLLMSGNVKFIDEGTGKELQGISKVVLTMEPNEMVVAEVVVNNIYQIDLGGAMPRMLSINPNTGELQRVAQIIFSNGDIWNADEVQ